MEAFFESVCTSYIIITLCTKHVHTAFDNICTIVTEKSSAFARKGVDTKG